MGVNLSGNQPTTPGGSGNILEDIFNGIGGIGAALINGIGGMITGTVGLVVGGIQAIFSSIGSLFGAGHRDTARVDAARVAAENAIVANMSESLEHLDEIQRVGGAYGHWPNWAILNGERDPHPVPLTLSFPLAQGTIWHSPSIAWDRDGSQVWNSNHLARGALAQRSGVLELAEAGLWMIYFQAAVLQGSSYPNDPADVWCYVRNTSTTIPVGTPADGMVAYDRITQANTTTNLNTFHTYGRAGSYLGIRDTGEGGGNTVSGYFMCYLKTSGWFISMSASAYKHFGGAASTFVFAQKVNSEDLRDDIEDLKVQIAAALPGQEVPLDLDDAAIAAMVAQAQGIEVPDVEVPNE